MHADTAGQEYNRPLARQMLASGDRFVDWELVTDEKGQRTTAFGSMAGIAGMADGLSIGLAMRLVRLCARPQQLIAQLGLGHSSPFIYLPRPLSHPSLDELYASLRKVGDRIRDEGTPAALGPLTVAVVGRGRVGHGCKTVLDHLGVKWVPPSELKALATSTTADLRRVYASQVTMEDHLRGIDGRPFDREDFAADPRAYRSAFADEVRCICMCSTDLIDRTARDDGRQRRLLGRPGAAAPHARSALGRAIAAQGERRGRQADADGRRHCMRLQRRPRVCRPRDDDRRARLHARRARQGASRVRYMITIAG